jgi:hypothetical protein
VQTFRHFCRSFELPVAVNAGGTTEAYAGSNPALCKQEKVSLLLVTVTGIKVSANADGATGKHRSRKRPAARRAGSNPALSKDM